jgi:hypothetical protein
MTEIAAVHASENATPQVWRRLLIATPIGWAIGIVAGVGLIVLAESVGLREMQAPLVAGLALGLSTQQYRGLRPVLGGLRARWVFRSCVGLAFPFIIADAATIAGRPLAYDLVLFVVLGGVIASVLQWGLLRNAVHRAGRWLIASPVGYLAAASTAWLNDRVLPKTPGIVGALQYLAVILGGGVLLGALTALAASRFRLRLEPRERGGTQQAALRSYP